MSVKKAGDMVQLPPELWHSRPPRTQSYGAAMCEYVNFSREPDLGFERKTSRKFSLLGVAWNVGLWKIYQNSIYLYSLYEISKTQYFPYIFIRFCQPTSCTRVSEDAICTFFIYTRLLSSKVRCGMLRASGTQISLILVRCDMLRAIPIPVNGPEREVRWNCAMQHVPNINMVAVGQGWKKHILCLSIWRCFLIEFSFGLRRSFIPFQLLKFRKV